MSNIDVLIHFVIGSFMLFVGSSKSLHTKTANDRGEQSADKIFKWLKILGGLFIVGSCIELAMLLADRS